MLPVLIVIQCLLIDLIQSQCIPLESRFSPSSQNNSSGFIIFDGDIAVHATNSPTTSDNIIDKLNGQQSVRKVSTNLWPNGIIPYALHDSVKDSKTTLSAISSAMKHWESNSCIRFIEKEETDHFWMTLRSDSTGCFSFIGRDETCKKQGQPVSLSKGCDSFLVAAHEIGHVIGLRHQHNRLDRDDFIHINWNNLIPGRDIYFKKESYDTFGIPYDYTSLMQYNSWHFSNDVMNKTAIVTSNPLYQRFLGKANGLSFRDKKLVNLLYKCASNCSSDTELKCLNEGFLSQGCSCVCPPNTTGKSCETVLAADYYDSLSCGEFITREGSVISTTSQRNESLNCVWIIQAPQDKVVQLTLQDFSLHPRGDLSRLSILPNGPPDMKCINESLEVRLDDPFDGTFFCGSDLKKGSILTSTLSRVIILLSSSVKMSPSSFSAVIGFVDKTPPTTTSSPLTTSPSRMDKTTTINPNVILVPSQERPWTPWLAFLSVYHLLLRLLVPFHQTYQG